MLVLKLGTKVELAAWLTATFLLFVELMLSHTFYVTKATYWYGAALCLTLIFMFILRFRSGSSRPRWLTLLSNILLGMGCLVFVLYALGVLTWYE